MLSTASGFQSMLKEGSKHYSGLDEAILKNIAACKEISNMTKTSLGPNGNLKNSFKPLKVWRRWSSTTLIRYLWRAMQPPSWRSWRCNTQQQRWSKWPARCRKENVVMEPIWLSPWQVSSSVKLNHSSRWVFIRGSHFVILLVKSLRVTKQP